MDARVRQNLVDAGCSDDFVCGFECATSDAERLRQLKGYRSDLLGSIHAEQHKLDCLDYLIYRMKEETR